MRALLSKVSGFASHSRKIWSNPRALLPLNGEVLLLRASFDEPFSSIVVAKDLPTEDKEEVKKIVLSFLKKQGMSSDVSVETVKKSNLFLDHLVSKLHSVRMSRHPGSLAEQELSTIEIREILIPYLESFSEQPGVPNVADNFINWTIKEVNSVSPIAPSNVAFVRRKLRALTILDKRDLDGNLAPLVLYLLEVGFDLEQIKKMAWKYPALTSSSLEGKIKPLIEFLHALGASKSDTPTILCRWPHLFGRSIKKRLLPKVALLESLGVNKRRWPEVLRRGAFILCLSRQNIEATVNFLLEMGVRSENIGIVIERSSTLIGGSVEDKLRPIAEYFRSFGVDVAKLLHRHPNLFNLSIESNLKHVTRFFLENGFSEEELGKMTTRFGCIYCYSLANNMIPKWEYFLTMDYPREDLIRYPYFFGYSLEKRIKPRHTLMKEYGVKMSLKSFLLLSDLKFVEALKKKLDKGVSDKVSRVTVRK